MLLILERRLLTSRINPELRFGKGLLTKSTHPAKYVVWGKHQAKSRHHNNVTRQRPFQKLFRLVFDQDVSKYVVEAYVRHTEYVVGYT